MKLLLLASEVSPWSKTGGLADVTAALPKALARRGHQVTTVTPKYKSVRDDRMPRDETGIESPLPAAQKETLLTLGAAFERSVVQAREWEEAQRK